jgi:hypothetical protein
MNKDFVTMPVKLTEEMTAVIRNDKCVYRTAQELYADLIAAGQRAPVVCTEGGMLYTQPTQLEPELPEPEGVIVVGTQALRAFTADQMEAYANARVDYALSAIAADRNKREDEIPWGVKQEWYDAGYNDGKEVAPRKNLAPVSAGLSDEQLFNRWLGSRAEHTVSAKEAFLGARAIESRLSIAAQQKVPDGWVAVPMIPNSAMQSVMAEEDWQWEDLLAAVGAITEEQYDAIAAAPSPQGQPLPNTLECKNHPDAHFDLSVSGNQVTCIDCGDSWPIAAPLPNGEIEQKEG